MDNKPKVSIIIPVYNTATFLEKCLNSVLRQSLKEIEIICINDGSTDGSQAILERYAQADNRVRVLVKMNEGQSSARNMGLDVATGEYIGFVDSDDFIAPQMMETLYTKAKRFDADIVITNCYIYNNNTKRISEFRNPALFFSLENKVVSLDETPELISCIAVWDRLYKRSLLSGIRFAEGLVYEDHLYTVQTLIRAKRIVAISDKLYYYRKFGGSSTTDKEVKNDNYKENFLDIHAKIRNVLSKENVSKEACSIYATYFMQNAFMHQGNIVTLQYFRKFFSRVQNMMSDTEYEQAKKFRNLGWRKYAQWLENNQVFCCFIYFRARSIAKKLCRHQAEGYTNQNNLLF